MLHAHIEIVLGNERLRPGVRGIQLNIAIVLNFSYNSDALPAVKSKKTDKEEEAVAEIAEVRQEDVYALKLRS